MKRSPLFYIGDKAKLLDQILPLIPENINNYYEPFLGGGSVAMNITANNYFLSDIDKNLINVHKALGKKNSLTKVKKIINDFGLIAYYNINFTKEIELLKKEFPKTYFAKINKESYLKLRKYYNKNKTPLELYVLIIYSFNRLLRFNKNNEYNVPVGNLIFNEKVELSLLNYQEFVNKNNIFYNCLDFSYLFDVDFKENDFVYLDPPYLITNAEYNKIWNAEQEEKLYNLLNFLDSKGVKFMLSNVYQYEGKQNKFLNNLSKFKFTKLKSNYINCHNNTQKDIIEIIVTNY